MKLTCPACSAKYNVSDERLDGRRVKVRCKRCGESFRVEPTQDGGQVYAQPSEPRRSRDADLFAGLATAGAEPEPAPEVYGQAQAPEPPRAPQLTGERNESSVLFSLATLGSFEPEPPVKTTESSALIDIRALVAAGATSGEPVSRADDVANLTGGGVFAPLFASPLPPVTLTPPPSSEQPARRGKGAVMIGAIAVAAVTLLGITALVGVRARAAASAAKDPSAEPATSTPAASASAEGPRVAEAAPTATGITPKPEASQAPASPVAMAPQPARSVPRTGEARPIATASAAPSPTTATPPAAAPSKCCPGEAEMACQMRLSVGGTCSAASTTSPVGAAPPFDRAAAGRALGISVASCKRADGPTGPGHLKVTFQPSGSVSAVDMEPPYAGTPTGACIAQRFRAATVPAFSGSSLSVGKGFAIE